MIVSTIKQFGLRLRADPEEIPFQYSANVQMKFEKDENYNDYTVVGYYIPPGENEAKLLSINDDGTFILGPDCFKQRGTLSFSFNLINSIEEVHLGSIDFEVRYSFGDGDTILPEPEEVWISLVTHVAKDAIREEVALVKQKANEALQSASLANDKANEAQEYANNANQSAGSASLSASSALTAKNDAIAASNQALGFSNNASESAIEAKNSADEALENANASNKAIETVNQIKTQIEDKANEFDTNYQEKQNAFNQSVTSANDLFDKKVVDANSDLDTKLQQANTTIDEKVKEATKQAEKATNEANRAEQALENKLDKNQGAENVGLTLVVGEDGNLKLGESTPKDVYTKEEVDYMLADKMDKPYVPIEITDNATITDALEGNFKIDKIKGNTYQNVEENIVPTPQRPVPINSRKVLANGEYVELRSLKETINKFDLGLLSQTNLITNSGAYRKINIPITLKPNTRYKIYYEKSMIPALTWSVLNIVDNTEKILTAILNVKNTENNEVEKQAINIAFTSPIDGEIYFSYFVQSFNAEGVQVPQNTEVFKEKWFTKILKNIMITEESLNQTTYVAPTVRDYKIVDHTTKTSKIVRNVGTKGFDGSEDEKWESVDSLENTIRFRIELSTAKNNSEGMCSNNTWVTSGVSLDKSVIGVSGGKIYYRLPKTVLNSLDLENFKMWLQQNPFTICYELLTQTEETITYVETDTSEVGYSWQDTTSPSPTIKSEVKGVEEIDILKTGKNLFDIEGHEFTTNLQSGKTDNNRIVKVNNTTLRIQNPNVNNYAVGDKFVVKANEPLIISFDILEITGTEQINVVFYKETGSLLKGFEYRTIKVGTRFVIDTPITTRNNYVYIGFQSVGAGSIVTISNILLEHASIATTYEPPTEQHVNIMLPQPMYSTLDGSIADEVDIDKKEFEYKLIDLTFDGSIEEKWVVVDSGSSVNTIRFNITLKSIRSYTYSCEELNHIDGNIGITDVEGLYYSGSNNSFDNDIRIRINKDRLETPDVNGLRKWLQSNPLHMTLLATTPTTQPIPEEDLKLLKSLKTEQGVTNIFVGGEVKPTIEARYPQDVVLAVNRLQTKLLTLQEEVVKNV
ncbi:hypothetical protein [Thomasclavelia spiroformis]|uniref:hypothetical protein n=1 Tax=Thomasclavelia spiroformis TaxID=29348 RepID=UPI002941D606|nr:hypothetical protein [Thomasclavelia spiroformis]